MSQSPANNSDNPQSPYQAVPVAISPCYFAWPNEPIELSSGQFELQQANVSLEGPGKVTWKWVPRPQIVISIANGLDVMKFEISDAQVRSAQLSTNVVIKTKRVGQEHGKAPVGSIEARPETQVEFGEPTQISHLVFHIANFWEFAGIAIRNTTATRVWSGRAVLTAEPWIVTIDAIDLDKDGPAFKEALHDGSYAFTHVGEIRRVDGNAFSISDCERLIDALYWFLSFVRGNWTAPSLLVALDASKKRTWERWKEQKIYRWRELDSWFNRLTQLGLAGLLPGFLKTWEDETWHEPIRLSIHWYVETNNTAGGLEGSIVLQQAAFELLAWTLLVEDRKILSIDGFSKLPAADKLRLLLSECDIPLDIHASLDALQRRAKALNWVDGPQALVGTRNALVHPDPEKREQVLGHDEESRSARHDTWCLSTWYLELVILHLLGYSGHYSNRLVRNGWRGDEVENVPWAR